MALGTPMWPQRVEGQEDPPVTLGPVRLSIASIIVIGAIVSLAIAPMPGAVTLMSVILGVSAAAMYLVEERGLAAIGAIIVVFVVPTLARRMAPELSTVWWEPLLVAGATMFSTYFGTRLIRLFRQRRAGSKAGK